VLAVIAASSAPKLTLSLPRQAALFVLIINFPLGVLGESRMRDIFATDGPPFRSGAIWYDAFTPKRRRIPRLWNPPFQNSR
jgi:hypothetical protein